MFCFILFLLRTCRGKGQKALIQSWIKSPVYKLILTHEGVEMLPSEAWYQGINFYIIAMLEVKHL